METVMQKYFDDIVKSSAEILRFDSSLKPAEEGYPFGKETADCLAYFLNLASDMGFETHNYDNYVGEVVFGEGKDFAILAHLDVVPAGNGWKYPPFGGVINDDISMSTVLNRHHSLCATFHYGAHNFKDVYCVNVQEIATRNHTMVCAYRTFSIRL